MKNELNKLQIAIIVTHTMRRMMRNFEPHERTAAIEMFLKRTKRFLLHHQKTNFALFTIATEFERRLYINTTNKYDKKTEIFSIDFTAKLYNYYEEFINKYTSISPKLIEKLSIQHNPTEVSLDKSFEIEMSDDDLLHTYVKLFEPLSGIGIKKSLFAGKKLTIKNNLILEGKSIRDGF